MTHRLLGIVLSAAIAAPAWAQPGTAPAPCKPGTTCKQAKVKVLNIGPEDVTGDRVTGDFVPIGVKEAASSSSLIRIRTHFVDLILKSAQDV